MRGIRCAHSARAALWYALPMAWACAQEATLVGGRSLERVTGERVSVLTPVQWAADGDRLFYRRIDQFVAGDAGKPACDSTGLYVFEPGKGAIARRIGTPLCRVLWDLREIDLSHDQQSLLFADMFESGTIYRFDLEDLSGTAIVDTCLPHHGAPAWSPDDASIAFTANCDDPNERGFLHVATAAGSEIQPIGPPVHGMPERQPDWAPGGQQVVVTMGSSTSTEEIVVVNTTTGERRVLTRGYAPAWSPANDWIAYLRKDAAAGEWTSIRLIRPDGGGDRILLPAAESGTTEQAFDQLVFPPLVWSPDGSQVAFTRGASIWVIGVDGTQRELIARQR